MLVLMYFNLIQLIVYLRQTWIKNHLQSKGKMWNITPEVIYDTLRGFRIIIFLGVILM